jgi:hypothetical protein
MLEVFFNRHNNSKARIETRAAIGGLRRYLHSGLPFDDLDCEFKLMAYGLAKEIYNSLSNKLVVAKGRACYMFS